MKHIIKDVLFIGRDLSFQQKILSKINYSLFNILGIRSSIVALQIISNKKFDIVIIDENILTNELYFGHQRSSIEELYEYVLKYNSSSAFIYIYEKKSTFVRSFKKRTNTTALLSRKMILASSFSYLLTILSKEYFKVVFLSDLRPDIVLDCNLYFIEQDVSESKTYLKKGTALTSELLEYARARGIQHLYIKQDELNSYIDQQSIFSKKTERIHKIRENIRDLAINLLDHSASATPVLGAELFSKSDTILHEIQDIISTFPSVTVALESLPFPRSNILNHYINSTIYALGICKILILDNAIEIGMAALLHDIGHYEVDQDFALDKMTMNNMNYLEKIERELHVQNTLKILRQNNFPLIKITEELIVLHHENISGTGYPDGIQIPEDKWICQVLSLADEIDYRRSINRGEIERTFIEIFNEICQENLNTKIFSDSFLQKISLNFRN